MPELDMLDEMFRLAGVGADTDSQPEELVPPEKEKEKPKPTTVPQKPANDMLSYMLDRALSGKPEPDPAPLPEQPPPNPGTPPEFARLLQDTGDLEDALLTEANNFYTYAPGGITPAEAEAGKFNESARKLLGVLEKRGLTIDPELFGSFLKRAHAVEQRLQALFGPAWDAIADPETEKRIMALAYLDLLVDQAGFKNPEDYAEVRRKAAIRIKERIQDRSKIGYLKRIVADKLDAFRADAVRYITDPDAVEAEEAARMVTEIMTGKQGIDPKAIAAFSRTVTAEQQLVMKQEKLRRLGVEVPDTAFDKSGQLDFRLLPFFKDARNRYELLRAYRLPLKNPRYFFRHEIGHELNERVARSPDEAAVVFTEITGFAPDQETFKWFRSLSPRDRVRAFHRLFSMRREDIDVPTGKGFGPATHLRPDKKVAAIIRNKLGRDPYTVFKSWTSKRIENELAALPQRRKEVNRLLDNDFVDRDELWSALSTNVLETRNAYIEKYVTEIEKKLPDALSPAEAKARLLSGHNVAALTMKIISWPWEVLSKGVGYVTWGAYDKQTGDAALAGIGKLILGAQAAVAEPDRVARETGVAAPAFAATPTEAARKTLFGSDYDPDWADLYDEFHRGNLSWWEHWALTARLVWEILEDMPSDIAQAAINDPLTFAIGGGILKGAAGILKMKNAPLAAKGVAMATQMFFEPWRVASIFKRALRGVRSDVTIAYGVSARKFRRILNRMPEKVRKAELKKFEAYKKMLAETGLAPQQKLETLSNMLHEAYQRLERGEKVGLPEAHDLMRQGLETLGAETARMALLPEKLRSKVPAVISDPIRRRLMLEHELEQWVKGEELGQLPDSVARAVLTAKDAWLNMAPGRFVEWFRQIRPRLLDPLLEQFEKKQGFRAAAERIRTWADMLEKRATHLRDNIHWFDRGEAAFEAYKQHRLQIEDHINMARTFESRFKAEAEAAELAIRSKRTEVEVKRQQLQQLETELARHEARFAEHRRQMQSSQREIKRAINQAEWKKADIKGKLEWIKEELKRQQAKLKAAKAKKSKWAVKYEDKIRELRQQQARLKEELAARTNQTQLLREQERGIRESVEKAPQKLQKLRQRRKQLLEELEQLRREADEIYKSQRFKIRLRNELLIDIGQLEQQRKLKLEEPLPGNLQRPETGYKSALSTASRRYLYAEAARDWITSRGTARWIPEAWHEHMRDILNQVVDTRKKTSKLYKAAKRIMEGKFDPKDVDTIVTHLTTELPKRARIDIPPMEELYLEVMTQLREQLQILHNLARDQQAGYLFADYLTLDMDRAPRWLLMGVQNQASHFLAEPHKRRLDKMLVRLAELAPEDRALVGEYLRTGEVPDNPRGAVERIVADLERERHAFIDAVEEAGLIEPRWAEELRQAAWQEIYNLSEEVRKLMPERPGKVKYAPPLLNWPEFGRLKPQRRVGEVRVLWRDPKTGTVKEKRFEVPGKGEEKLRPKNINQAMREAKAWLKEQLELRNFRPEDVLFEGPIKPRDYKSLALKGAIGTDPELRIEALKAMWSDLIRNRIYYNWGLTSGWIKMPGPGGEKAGPPGVPIDRAGEWKLIDKKQAFGPLAGKWVHKQLLRELNAWDEGWRVLEAVLEGFREDFLETPTTSVITRLFRRPLGTLRKFLYRILILRNPATWSTNCLTNISYGTAMHGGPLEKTWRRAYHDFDKVIEAWEDGRLKEAVAKGEISPEYVEALNRGMFTGQLSPTVASPTAEMFGTTEARHWRDIRKALKDKYLRKHREIERQLEYLERWESDLVQAIDEGRRLGHKTTQLQRRLAEVQAAKKKLEKKIVKAYIPTRRSAVWDAIKGITGISEDSVVGDYLNRWYSLMDARAKFATIVTLAKKLGWEEALQWSMSLHQQYGFVPPSVRRLRNIPLLGAFVPSFAYEAPRILKNVFRRAPWMAVRLFGVPFTFNMATMLTSGITLEDMATIMGSDSPLETFFKLATGIVIPLGGGKFMYLNVGKYQLVDVFTNAAGLGRPIIEQIKKTGSLGYATSLVLSPFSQFIGAQPELDWVIRLKTGIDPWQGEELVWRGGGLGKIGKDWLTSFLPLMTPRAVSRAWEEFVTPEPPSPVTEHERYWWERVLSITAGISLKHITPKTYAARVALQFLSPEEVKSLVAEAESPQIDILKRQGWLAHAALLRGDVRSFKKIVKEASEELAKKDKRQVYINGVWIDISRSPEEWAKKLINYATRNSFATIDRVPIKYLPDLCIRLSASGVADKEHVEYAWERLLNPERLKRQLDPTKVLPALQRAIRYYKTTTNQAVKARLAVAVQNLYVQLVRALINEKRRSKAQAIIKFLTSPRGKQLRALVDVIR